MYHRNVNVDVTLVNVSQIKSGIMINVGVSECKNLKEDNECKKNRSGVLLNIVVKLVNI